MLLTGLLLASTGAQAHTYECGFVSKDSSNPHSSAEAMTFVFDTDVQENTFHEAFGLAVGCVVLRTNPERLSCVFGQTEKDMLSVSDLNGATQLYLNVSSYFGRRDVQLTCNRK